MVIAFFVIPVFASDYWLQAILIPFLIFSLAALGLNLLTGYAGQLSLGTGGFMAVGAYSCYKLVTLFPNTNVILLILLSGLFSAVVGIIFGLPSLRIKGFYLAVATLAAQFFFEWLFGRVGWFVFHLTSDKNPENLQISLRTLVGSESPENLRDHCAQEEIQFENHAESSAGQ